MRQPPTPMERKRRGYRLIYWQLVVVIAYCLFWTVTQGNMISAAWVVILAIVARVVRSLQRHNTPPPEP